MVWRGVSGEVGRECIEDEVYKLEVESGSILVSALGTTYNHRSDTVMTI